MGESRWHGFKRATAAALALAGWMMAACGVSDKPAPPPPSEGQATIGSAGGKVSGPDGVAVTVPAGALAQDVTLRVARDGNGAPAMPAGFESHGSIYQFTPHGRLFESPVTIALPVDVDALAPGAAPLFFHAQPGDQWIQIVAAQLDGNRLVAPSLSFSYGNVGIGYVDPNVPVAQRRTVREFALIAPSGLPLANGWLPTINQPTTVTIRVALDADFVSGRCASVPTIELARAIKTATDNNTPPSWAYQPVGSHQFAAGSYQFDFDVALDHSHNGTNWFIAKFDCVLRPGGPAVDGTRWFLFGYVRVKVQIAVPPGAPSIGQHPQSLTVSAGSRAEFRVVASAPDTLVINWQRSDDGGATWSTVASSGEIYALDPAQLADNGARFRAQVCNALGVTLNCVISDVATLTVTPAATAPQFTQHPQSMTIVAGQTASLTAVATGTPAPTVRWFRIQPAPGGLPTEVGTPCSGGGTQTACSYTTPALSTLDSGVRYYAEASNSAGSVASDSATITVLSAPIAPSIPAGEPADVTITAGQSATFSVNATGTAPLSYQWHRNGAAIAGANAASYTLANAQVADNGARFSVTVTNGAGSATSRAALLTVTAPPPGSASGCFADAQGWCFLAPKPQANHLTALAFDATGLAPRALGHAGTVVRSNDLGATWAASWDGAKTLWTDVARLPSGVLFATGRRPGELPNLYVSSDDGATWSAVLALNFPEDVRGVAFANANVGVAAGSSVWRTTDGGATWSEVATSVLQDRFAHRVAANGVGGFVLVGDEGFIAHSADGGATWTQRASGSTIRLRDVAFNGAGVGVAVGDAANEVLRTTDGGLTWSAVGVSPGFSAVSVAFADANTVVAFGTFSDYIRSTDGGLTWSSPGFADGATQTNLRVRFGRDGIGLAVGDFGTILRSVDFGETWDRVAGGRSDASIIALESRAGVALASTLIGHLQRSSDGGLTWSVVPTAPRDIDAISWGDNNTALAVGRFGSIHKTTDAGVTWSTVYEDANAFFNAGAMATATTAVIAGHTSPSDRSITGFMLRTTNGGQTWSPVSLPTTRWLSTIRFLTPLIGLAGGGNATLLRTADGGQTWTTVDFQPQWAGEWVQSITRVSDTVAIIATDSGLKRSTDGGLTWTRVYDSLVFGSMKGAAFRDANTGVAVGVPGILRTTDGGATWTRLDLPLGFLLTTATWPTPTAPLVGGEGGALLRNQRSGAP